MNNEITISELARLMSVSVHQLRYFEEKDVLTPAYTDHNQYRMYGIDQVYQLAHILLLRKLGVPVQSIKECMTSYSADQYTQLLHQSLQKINAELLRLQELQQFITKVLQEQQEFNLSSDQYQIKWRDTAYLSHWLEIDAQTKLTARSLAEQASHLPDLFESDIYYIENEANILNLYTETQGPGVLTLPEGNYLSVQRQIHEDDELEQVVEQFFVYAAAQSYVIAGPVIIIEKSYLSLFTPNGLHYELQALLEPYPERSQPT
ncbi:MerR family transcriptional regulator [Paenibacillus motobuensis]|uniref:MerR family transcriptional regulator n=1 Tax=Paenibacillus TaxID=44249 RepID=UPI00204031B0|nr:MULTISPECIES: MerR family transcriptional regulator [Paenibacillus]MCM3041184.1 MerR family transcriptional regulator [Paenibacillus lutimineralis]MCM3648288.1 MerR family transcriptional regulator [Paenibacillus motobuensis]